METIICPNEKELVAAIAEFLDTIISLKIGNKENFSLGLSGGSVVEILSKVLLSLPDSKYRFIHFFFCDERFVDRESKDLTFNLYNEALFSKRETCSENIHNIDLTVNLNDSSANYKRDVLSFFRILNGDSINLPKFDLLFLGLGPDGHTASLFPNHILLKENKEIIACLDDSPKPPDMRITMTLPLINSAHNVCVIAIGESKADIVKNQGSKFSYCLFTLFIDNPTSKSFSWVTFKEVEEKNIVTKLQSIIINQQMVCIHDFNFGGHEGYPVSLVRPYNGRLIWFLDKDSAKLHN